MQFSRVRKVKVAIEDILDAGLPYISTLDCCQQKCSAIFEHVYERYPKRDASVYAATG